MSRDKRYYVVPAHVKRVCFKIPIELYLFFTFWDITKKTAFSIFCSVYLRKYGFVYFEAYPLLPY